MVMKIPRNNSFFSSTQPPQQNLLLCLPSQLFSFPPPSFDPIESQKVNSALQSLNNFPFCPRTFSKKQILLFYSCNSQGFSSEKSKKASCTSISFACPPPPIYPARQTYDSTPGNDFKIPNLTQGSFPFMHPVICLFLVIFSYFPCLISFFFFFSLKPAQKESNLQAKSNPSKRHRQGSLYGLNLH